MRICKNCNTVPDAVTPVRSREAAAVFQFPELVQGHGFCKFFQRQRIERGRKIRHQDYRAV